MANPRLASVKAAERTSRELLALFGQLGTTEHPRGAVMTAYRNAHRALRDVFKRRALAMQMEVGEVLGALRRELEVATSEALKQAAEIGHAQAGAELAAYGIEPVSVPEPMEVIGQAQNAWMTTMNNQIVTAQAVIASGGSLALVIGDATRGGVLQPGQVVREGTRWLVSVVMMARILRVGRAAERSGVDFRRQAAAAIDERTTDCCLRVHGQVVGMEQDFTLTGTPRFADKLRDPPFHWYCRTSQVLVRAEDAEDELTARMRAAAQAELSARAEAQRHVDDLKKRLADLGAMPNVRARAGDTDEVKRLRIELRKWRARLREEIHPASALSGR